MGRQAYLTRLAFGRSAYEPPEQQQGSEATVNAEAPIRANEGQSASEGENASPTLYEPPPQQYNERGRPINPQSRTFARELRAAQNDVLAAVGVCIRNSPPEDETRPSKQEEAELIESEELWGSMISLFGVIAKQSCTWWIGGLRDRLMTYRIHPGLTFTQAVSEEFRLARPAAFFFAGAPLYYSAIFLLDEEEWVDFCISSIKRAIIATVSSKRKRDVWERRLEKLRPYLIYAAEFLTSPALLHMTLQALLLSRDSIFLPPWRAFIPFSRWSPIRFPPLPSTYSVGSVAEWAIAAIQSPVLLITVYRHALVRTHGYLFHVFRNQILRPANNEPASVQANRGWGDPMDIDSDSEDEARTGPWFLSRALSFVGWSVPPSPPRFPYFYRRQSIQSVTIPLPEIEDAPESQAGPSLSTTDAYPPEALIRPDSSTLESTTLSPNIETGQQSSGGPNRQGVPLSAPTPPEPTSSHQRNDIPSTPQRATHRGVQVDHSNEQPPSSPMSTIADDVADPSDASIRIASNEAESGAVSLEIALPEPESSTTPEQEAPPSHGEGARSRQGNVTALVSHPDSGVPNPLYHVTDLSIEPAEMLSYILSDCAASWLLLPARLGILYSLSKQYARPGHRALRAPLATLVYGHGWAFPGLTDLPAIMGRVAACCAMEAVICAAFWGVECAVVVAVGRKWFGWGKKRKPAVYGDDDTLAISEST